VWTTRLDLDPARRAALAATLSSDEWERASRFRFETHRHRFVSGRGILRGVLAYYVGVEPENLRFLQGAHGKPELAPEFALSRIHFNLSHSEDLALIAVTRNARVGVDVERTRPLEDAGELVARFFSARENAAFQSLPPEIKPTAFYNLWTRKEAWLKATGEGIGHLLNRVEVTFLPDEPARLLRLPAEYSKSGPWSLRATRPAAGFAAALAVNSILSRVEYREWPQAHSHLTSPAYD
jgi:4'-phosphopantetheinyl transferase